MAAFFFLVMILIFVVLSCGYQGDVIVPACLCIKQLVRIKLMDLK